MKSKFFITLVAMLIGLSSCKNEKAAENPATAPEKQNLKENFFVTLTASASKKDDFAVYFTEDSTNDFSGINAVWSSIPGDGTLQTLTFDLPAAATPTNIRMDFGLNKEQESVEISNITLNFLGKTHSIKGSEFFNFFIKDDNFKTEVDATKGTLRITKNGGEYKTPYFYPRQELLDVIKNLVNPVA